MGSCFSSNHSLLPLKSSLISSQVPSSLLLNRYTNKIHEITTEEEFEILINDIQNVNVLIVCDFHAVWCSPCVQIAPVLYKWALNDYRATVIFIKVDIDRNDDLSNKFSISVLPTFVLFKQGKEINRVIGADPMKLKREIDKFK